jgi:hypothetical protein
VFANRRAAEQVLPELQNMGLSMSQVSIIAKDADAVEPIGASLQRLADETLVDEGAQAGTTTGGVVGGITGLLVGLGTLAIPGIGPVMLAGAAATAITTSPAGTAIGAATGGLLGGLIGLGIPEGQAQIYNDYVTQGEYLLIVDGTEEEVHKAESVLKASGIGEWAAYPFPSKIGAH